MSFRTAFSSQQGGFPFSSIRPREIVALAGGLARSGNLALLIRRERPGGSGQTALAKEGTQEKGEKPGGRGAGGRSGER